MKNQLSVLAGLDRVIHEPGRLMIVASLSGVEKADFMYVQRETGMNKGTLSSHLARLEEAGYVKVEKTYRGKIPQTLLSLTAAGRKALSEYRKMLRTAL